VSFRFLNLEFYFKCVSFDEYHLELDNTILPDRLASVLRFTRIFQN